MIWRLFDLLKLNRLSIYPRLVASFLLVTMPIALLSFTVNNSSERLISKQIGAAMNLKVHYYLSAMENEIVRLNNFKYEFVNDSDLQSLSTIPEAYDNYELQKSLLNLNDKMRFFKSSSSFIDRVKIHIPKLGRSVFSDKVYAFISDEEIKAIRFPKADGYPIIPWEGKLIIGEVYPFSIKPDANYSFVLEVELSSSAIANSLKDISVSPQSGSLLFQDKQGWVVTDGKNDMLQHEILAQLRSTEYRTDGVNLVKLTLAGARYLVAYEKSVNTGLTLAVYESEEQFLQPLNQYRVWFWMLLLMSLSAIVLFSYWIRRLIHRPIHHLVSAFKRVETENWSIAIQRRQHDEFHYLYNQFNAMVSRIRLLIMEVYEQKIRMQRSELKQLQSQINPHFIYNSYYSIYRLAENEDVEKMMKYTRYLGDYFYFITRNSSDEVPLSAEIKHALAYVEIQMLRYSQRISTIFGSVPPDAGVLMVPRLILQPIIENAYEHGLRDKANGGIVEILFNIQPDRYTITVDDNGDALSDKRLRELEQSLRTARVQETTGLINVHRRLEIRFPSPSGLQLERSPLGGLRVIMTIIPHDSDKVVNQTTPK